MVVFGHPRRRVRNGGYLIPAGRRPGLLYSSKFYSSWRRLAHYGRLRHREYDGVILYYITDRKQFPGVPAEQRARLLAKIAEASQAGIDMIQLREKDLSVRELQTLALDAMELVRKKSRSDATRLLINSRCDVAIAAGADGVHLPAGNIAASEARVIFGRTGAATPVIGVSCHSLAEVRLAESHGADFSVFGPVFEKLGAGSQGLAALLTACGQVAAHGIEAAVPAGRMPVLALGGVTLENAGDCLQAGAAGIAAIRLFQENDMARVVEALRAHKTKRSG